MSLCLPVFHFGIQYSRKPLNTVPSVSKVACNNRVNALNIRPQHSKAHDTNNDLHKKHKYNNIEEEIVDTCKELDAV